MKGMIVYSFGWRRKDYGPCNVLLAMAAKRIIQDEKEQVLVFAQRSIAVILKEFGVKCDVSQKQAGGYEGSEEPTRQACEIFQKRNIKEVIPVAQPFLHLTKCIRLIRKQGLTTISYYKLARKIGWIGFDSLSVQPATRSPFKLLFYAVRQIFFGYRLPFEQSEP